MWQSAVLSIAIFRVDKLCADVFMSVSSSVYDVVLLGSLSLQLDGCVS